jgi:hypothetical protein
MERARTAVRDLLALLLDFAAKASEELGKRWLPDMVEQMLSHLRRLGWKSSSSGATQLVAKTES